MRLDGLKDERESRWGARACAVVLYFMIPVRLTTEIVIRAMRACIVTMRHSRLYTLCSRRRAVLAVASSQ